MNQGQGLERVRSVLLAPSRLLSFRNGFWGMVVAKSISVAHHGLTQVLALLRSTFSAKTICIAKRTNSHFFTGLGSMLPVTHGRASNTGKIISLLTKGLEMLKPVLFTGSQGHRQNQFQDFEGESIGAVLVPSPLQVGIAVFVSSKLAEVLVSAMAQVKSTTNVDFASNGANNFVNARCGGDGRGHVLTPLVSALCCLLSGRQGYAFSAWEATPSLDNTSIIPFFLPPEKRKKGA